MSFVTLKNCTMKTYVSNDDKFYNFVFIKFVHL